MLVDTHMEQREIMTERDIEMQMRENYRERSKPSEWHTIWRMEKFRPLGAEELTI
jgi:hypothetical protein